MAVDHFQKHRYQENQRDWNFNVLFDGQSAVIKMAKDYARLLDHQALYPPVPPRWLHATILRVGSVDDYRESEMVAVAEILQHKLACLELPTFAFDSWWLWGGNVVLHISPEDQFSKLHDHLICALRAVVGRERVDTLSKSEFIPHVTLAYTRSHHREHEINARLAAGPVESAVFVTTRLSLISQWQTGGHYEWRVVKNIPVGRD
jgi:2'-5' RNA ligase